jgi:hypothetical protein
MLTGTAAREDHTGSTSFVDLVPTPGESFATTQTSTLTALFIAECRINTPGQHLEIRIMVDNQVADPGQVTLTAEPVYSTHSHLAFKTAVGQGNHTVTVQWRVSGGPATFAIAPSPSGNSLDRSVQRTWPGPSPPACRRG